MLDDLNDMLIFAEVVRAGNLTRAGVALNIPKATVSRRLAALETRIGTRLVEITTRRLGLTEAGEAYYEHCLPILEHVEEAHDFASQLSDRPRGRLRVSAPADMAQVWLAGPLADFCKEYPEIVLELYLTSRRVDLIAEHFDVAIRTGALGDSSLVSRVLGEMKLSLYASPSYLKKAGTPQTPADLSDHDFVLLRGSTKLMDAETLRNGTQSHKIAMRGRVHVDSIAMLCALTHEGLGIGLMPDAIVKHFLASRQLVRLLPEWTPVAHRVQLLMPSRRFLPRKTQLFVEHMMKAAPLFTTPIQPDRPAARAAAATVS